MYIQAVTSKNAVSYYVAEATYRAGKHSSRIVEKLGTLAEVAQRASGQDPQTWMKEYVQGLNAQKKAGQLAITVKFMPNAQIGKGNPRRFNVGYLFLQSIYYALGLDKLCRRLQSGGNCEYDLNAVLSRLIYTRILYPSSKLSSWEASKRLAEPPCFELQHIYRAMDVLLKNSGLIESHVYEASKKLVNRNSAVLYYDCTNYFFEIEEEDELRQYGKSKEHRPNPIVQMGLFMDGGGIPLAFEMSGGAKNEQTTLQPLEQRIINDFKLSKFIVCTDGGLGSMGNRMFNDAQDRAFVVTQSLKKLEKSLIDWALDTEGWRLPGCDGSTSLKAVDDSSQNAQVYYKSRKMRAEVEYNGKKEVLEQTLFVTYSPKYKAYQRHIRDGQIERARKLAEKPGALNRKNPNDPSRFIKVTPVTKDGEAASQKLVVLNQEAIDKEARFDGFYGVCTNLGDDFETIIKINRGRWEIEESFRILKSEFRSRPVYHWKGDRIRAHFLTCFLALSVYRLLEKKLGEKYTVSELMETLRGMDLAAAGGEGYVPAYMRTDLTDDLHESFGFRTDWQIVQNSKLKKVFKASKTPPALVTFEA